MQKLINILFLGLVALLTGWFNPVGATAIDLSSEDELTVYEITLDNRLSVSELSGLSPPENLSIISNTPYQFQRTEREIHACAVVKMSSWDLEKDRARKGYTLTRGRKWKKLAVEAELVNAWKRLDGLGRAQMKKDPSILTSVKKVMDNPNVPEDKMDNIVNKLAESGARCKTCDTPGQPDLRFVDEVLDDLDGFAIEFKDIPGLNSFLDEMGQTGRKATGGSWTLDALMNNRSKYFGNEIVDGFEIKHVPGRDFAADVVSKNGDKLIYNEFKSWSSNLMGQSNMVDQMTGTLTQISNLDEMRFVFDANRWVPDPAKLKTALQGKSDLFDELFSNGKLQELMPNEIIDSTSDFIDNLASPQYFNIVFKVQ